MIRAVAALALVAAAGCAETVAPWELDHDRIIAVRASPPHLAAGERATIDVLVSVSAVPGVVEPADVAGDRVIHTDLGWQVEAPPGSTAAVEILVTVDVGGVAMSATKTVHIGETATNPELGAVTVDGIPAADGMIVAAGAEVALAIDGPPDATIAWSSSVGELEDHDDAAATLTTVDTEAGHLVVVRRDDQGGVAWAFWSLAVR